METPTRVSSHRSTVWSTASCIEREEVSACKLTDETSNVSHFVEMSGSDSNDISSGNYDLSTVSTECQAEFLKAIQDNASCLFAEFSFVMSHVSIDGAQLPVLMITPHEVFDHPPLGIMPQIQVIVRYKFYTMHVLMRLWKCENFESIEDIINLCKVISVKSQYKFCPGIQYKQYMTEFFDVIHFHIKSVQLTEFPFKRIDSVNCKFLFQLAHSATVAEKLSKEVKCYPCKRLVTDLKHQKRNTEAETPTRKVKRQRPSSQARMSYMSPASQAKRRKLAQYERTNNIRKLARYEEREIVVDDEQNDEMCALVKTMGEEELQKLYEEGDKHNVGCILKDIWATDLNRQQKEFSRNQATNCKKALKCYNIVSSSCYRQWLTR